MGNLIDIQSQIDKLQRQANDIKTREFDKTVQDIVATMRAYGIGVKDIQSALVAKARPSGKASGKAGARRKAAAAPAAGKAPATIAPKYRGPNGETWSGRGLVPRWLKALMDQGQAREAFLIAP